MWKTAKSDLVGRAIYVQEKYCLRWETQRRHWMCINMGFDIRWQVIRTWKYVSGRITTWSELGVTISPQLLKRVYCDLERRINKIDTRQDPVACFPYELLQEIFGPLSSVEKTYVFLKHMTQQRSLTPIPGDVCVYHGHGMDISHRWRVSGESSSSARREKRSHCGGQWNYTFSEGRRDCYEQRWTCQAVRAQLAST